MKRKKSAFTLVEIMVAGAVFSIAIGVIGSFFINNLKALFIGEQKLLINADIRKITNELVENARESSYFSLYRSFYSRTTPDGTSVTRGNSLVADGSAGDFLVMVYLEPSIVYDSRFYDSDATNDPAISRQVKRIVAYWVAPNRLNTAENALYRLDTDEAKSSPSDTTWTTSWGSTLPATLSSSATLESLLPAADYANATAAYAKIVIHDVRGTASSALNFVNSNNQGVLIRTRILHGNQAKRVTDTYNFGISPRG